MVNLSRVDPDHLGFGARTRVVCAKGSSGYNPLLCLSVVVANNSHIHEPAPIMGKQRFGSRYLGGTLINGEGQRLFNVMGRIFGVSTIGLQMVRGSLEFATPPPSDSSGELILAFLFSSLSFFSDFRSPYRLKL